MVNKKHSEKTVELLLGQYRAELDKMWDEGVSTDKICKYFRCRHESVLEALHRIHTDAEFAERKSNLLSESSRKHCAIHGPYKTFKHTDDKLWYSVIRKPSWFTGNTKHTHIYLHHFVYCCMHFITEIPAYHVVHHIDGDMYNNSPSNLVLLTRSAHARLHNKMRREGVTTIPQGSTCKCTEAQSIL